MALMVVGILFWMLAVAFPLTALHFRLFASLDHSDKLSLAVVAGGADVIGRVRNRGHEKGEAALRGAASDLYLATWQRPADVERFGDEKLLDAIRAQ